MLICYVVVLVFYVIIVASGQGWLKKIEPTLCGNLSGISFYISLCRFMQIGVRLDHSTKIGIVAVEHEIFKLIYISIKFF